jgi:hypothetical protein
MHIASAMRSHNNRVEYLNLAGIARSLGAVFSLLVGRLFADPRAIWRWAFHLDLCVAILAALFILHFPSIKPFILFR